MCPLSTFPSMLCIFFCPGSGSWGGWGGDSGLQRVWQTFTGLWMLSMRPFSVPCHPEARATFRALWFNLRLLAQQCVKLWAACWGGGAGNDTNGPEVWSSSADPLKHFQEETFSNCWGFRRFLALWRLCHLVAYCPTHTPSCEALLQTKQAGLLAVPVRPALLKEPCGRRLASGHAILSDVGKCNN